MSTKTIATIEDLYNVPDNQKAELVDGAIVLMTPTGFLPGRAAGEIYASLREYERQTKSGYALPDNVGFTVNLAHRKSFSPDAAFYIGQPSGMRFVNGAPVFAVEVRSEGDYGMQAEHEMAEKRMDYFATGTLVVWDVDLEDEEIRVYRASAPATPIIYSRGMLAEAEPALLHWTFAVDDLF